MPCSLASYIKKVMYMNESCLFCDIAARRVGASVVYEDNKVMAFLDINPLALGHVLLITKVHCETLFDVPEKTFSALFSAAQKIAVAQTSVLGAEGVNWLQNSGKAAGQEIFHFHIHLIPRMVDDGVGWSWKPSPYEIPEERDQLANQLSESLK